MLCPYLLSKKLTSLFTWGDEKKFFNSVNDTWFNWELGISLGIETMRKFFIWGDEIMGRLLSDQNYNSLYVTLWLIWFAWLVSTIFLVVVVIGVDTWVWFCWEFLLNDDDDEEFDWTVTVDEGFNCNEVVTDGADCELLTWLNWLVTCGSDDEITEGFDGLGC